jgi:hypothetical protein
VPQSDYLRTSAWSGLRFKSFVYARRLPAMKVMAMIRDRGCAALIVSHEVELIRKVRERRIPFAGGNSSGHVQPSGLPNLDLTLLGCENGT